MKYLIFTLCAIASYLIGSLNFSIIISKIKGDDIRNHGSGNAGSTNMLRTYGKKTAALAFIGDILKGVFAILLAKLCSSFIAGSEVDSFDYNTLTALCGIFVVLGHNFPVFFGFKGGKGIATSEAVIFMYNWKVGLIVLAVFIIFVVITRYVSLGSVMGAVTAPVSTFVIYAVVNTYNCKYLPLIILSVFVGILAIVRHHKNIKRLLNGTESKLGQKK